MNRGKEMTKRVLAYIVIMSILLGYLVPAQAADSVMDPSQDLVFVTEDVGEVFDNDTNEAECQADAPGSAEPSEQLLMDEYEGSETADAVSDENALTEDDSAAWEIVEDTGDGGIIEEFFEDPSETDTSWDNFDISYVDGDEEKLFEDPALLFAGDGEQGVYSGVDGTISWSVENGTLTISGTGAMTDYGSPEEVPWYIPCVKDYADTEEGLITSAVVEEGITSVGNYSFYGCRHLTTVSIADTVTRLGERSFAYCSFLPEVICTKISEVGAYAFDSCTSLEDIDLGKIASGAWLHVYSYAFKDCSSLKTIEFSSANIAPYSDYTPFIGCSSLKSVVYKTASNNAGYRGTGSYMYRYSQSINSVNYNQCKLIKCYPGSDHEDVSTEQYITEICPYAFYGAHNLKRLVVHDDTQFIGDYAFQDCSNLQSIQLGKRLETIGTLAFADCVQLESITIPGCVYEIGEDAFRGCNELRTVWFRGDAPSVGNGIFTSDMSLTVYYPENNTTWTTEAMSALGGNITWVPYTPELTPFSEDDFGVTIKTENYVYDGSEKWATVGQVKPRASSGSTILQEHPLTEGVNYDIVYEGNVQSGTAKVKVCGHGEYSGQIERSFYIQPKVYSETYAGTYDGKKHELVMTAEGDATLYFSATTPLTFSDYEESGTKTVPSRTSAGTTKVYYIAVPNHDPSEESCVSGEAEFTVTKARQSITAYISNDSLWIGESAQITASAKAGALSYSSDNENIATVDENGIVTGIGEGQTKINITAAETTNYKEDSYALNVSVSPQMETSLYDCDIQVQSGLTYTGTPVEPKVTIRYDVHTLVQDRDYSLQYLNNEAPGTGRVKITGMGYYIGSVTKTFEILEPGGPSERSIQDCEVTLSKTSFVYNEEIQIPTVTVKDGTTVLVKGRDYTVQINNAAAEESADPVDAGRYSLIVEGQGEYVDSQILYFQIMQAEPVLSFAADELEKQVTDEPFTNPLSAKTDGKLVFSSDDPTVAEVDPDSGKVTIITSGTTIIRVSALRGKNYLSGDTSFSLSVTEVEDTLTLENMSFSFPNSPKVFGYSKTAGFNLDVYEAVFGKTQRALTWYEDTSKLAVNGVCAGFSGAAALLRDGSVGVEVKDFNPSAQFIKDLKLSDNSAALNMSVKNLIEVMQVVQFTQTFSLERSKHQIRTSILRKRGNLNGFLNVVSEETKAGRPVILALQQGAYPNTLGHAVLAYGTRKISDQETQILLYDNNYPLQERVLTIQKDETGDYMRWAYEIGSPHGVWGTDNESSIISYVPYEVIKSIWASKGFLNEAGNLFSSNSLSIAIYDSESMSPVATVRGGELSTGRDDIVLVDNLSLQPVDEQSLLLMLPVDVYTIENLDRSVEEFEVSMTNMNLGTTVSTTARSVTLAVDDTCNLNAAFIEAGKEDIYSVTLNSTFDYDNNNVTISGMGSGETLEISQTRGQINISNCQILSMSIDGEEIKSYTVKASAGEGGKITPAGENAVADGGALACSIEAMDGYQISDVLVDGNSIGAVSSYTFRNVTEDHEIHAVFAKKPGSGNQTPQTDGKDTGVISKAAGQIFAEDVSLTTKNNTQSFELRAFAAGGARLSYQSDTAAVNVKPNGIVTIAGKFVGQAIITIHAAPTAQQEAVSKQITVTVNPSGTNIKKLSRSGSGQVTVSWKKNSQVTGYEISYSTSSAFTNAKSKIIKNSRTVKAVLKKLKKKKYYFRIRTYKTVEGRKYYSAWSKKKSVKVK